MIYNRRRRHVSGSYFKCKQTANFFDRFRSLFTAIKCARLTNNLKTKREIVKKRNDCIEMGYEDGVKNCLKKKNKNTVRSRITFCFLLNIDTIFYYVFNERNNSRFWAR